MSSVDRLLLSWPQHLAVPTVLSGGGSESWMQVARTGAFVSTRYGKFSITKADLSKMVFNFENITPKPPTQLPVDYDHLSMDVKKAGDGVAAGWIQKIELREDGDELWGLVKWTPLATKKIEDKEYQYVSPSFVKDYVYKDGKAIGTTLLAAAITNHPFLEGMKALTLSCGLGDFATIVPEGVLMLMEAGQKVTIKPGLEHEAGEAGVSLEIAEVVGNGDDAFVSLKDPSGVVHKWFRATDLAPGLLTSPEAEIDPATGLPKKKAIEIDPATGLPKKPVTVPGQLPAGSDVKSPADAATDQADKDAKKALAGILGVAVAQAILGKGMSMSQTFKLSTNTGEVEVTAEQLKAAGITVMTDEEAAAAAVKTTGLEQKVTSLSTQVAELATANAASAQAMRTQEMTAELERLSKGGFLLKAERDVIVKMFANAPDLTAFRAWAATRTHRLIKLDTEHGSGGEGEPETKNPGNELMVLAESIAKDQKIPLRDALIKASAQRTDLSESYRDQFDVEATATAH